jgi:hypothetical protein
MHQMRRCDADWGCCAAAPQAGRRPSHGSSRPSLTILPSSRAETPHAAFLAFSPTNGAGQPAQPAPAPAQTKHGRRASSLPWQAEYPHPVIAFSCEFLDTPEVEFREAARPHGAARLPRAQGQSACDRAAWAAWQCSPAFPTAPHPAARRRERGRRNRLPWRFWQAARPRGRSGVSTRRLGGKRLRTLGASLPPSTSRFGRAFDRAERIGSTKRTTSRSGYLTIQQIEMIPDCRGRQMRLLGGTRTGDGIPLGLLSMPPRTAKPASRDLP